MVADIDRHTFSKSVDQNIFSIIFKGFLDVKNCLRPKSATLTLFRMGEGGPKPPTSFSPVTSTNVGNSPQNFLTFSFNPFPTLV